MSARGRRRPRRVRALRGPSQTAHLAHPGHIQRQHLDEGRRRRHQLAVRLRRMERALNTMSAGALLERMERAPLSAWHVKARVVMGSATFFDAFNALSLAFALPALIQLWGISPRQSGFLIGASYLGQLFGALLFTALAERFGRV